MKIATNANCQRMYGLVYGFENSLVHFYVLKNSPNIDVTFLSSKKKVFDALATLELPVERKVAACQRKLLKHKESISEK